MTISDILKIQETLPCGCHACCIKATGFVNRASMWLCPNCGNKRCPKASDHTLDCTNSNEPGQAGSIF